MRGIDQNGDDYVEVVIVNMIIETMTSDIGISRISPSMLMEYRSCPKLFYYRSWLGLKLPQAMVHLDFGTAIHAAIDVMYEGRNPDGTWPPGEESAVRALAVFNEKFTIRSCKDITKTEAGVTRNLTEAEYTKVFQDMAEDGRLILKEYWGAKEVLLSKGIDPTQFEIPGKEVMLNPITKEPWPLPLSYRLDAILKDHGVGEFKTSSTPYEQFEVRSRPQSLCYVLAYYQKYGVIPVLHYVVMIKKRKKDKIQHLKFVYDMADLLAFDEEVRATLEQIRNREFSRPKIGHPRFCDCVKFEQALAY